MTVDNAAAISTEGSNSTGIYADSLGGGGMAGDDGVGFADDVIDFVRDMFVGSVGGEGQGGAVTVNQRANVLTSGENAHGIFAQSSGGTDPEGAALEARGNSAGAVSVTVAADIIATGNGSDGIVAQSYGLAGNGNVTVNVEGGVVQGGPGSAAGVRILDGAGNMLINEGTIRSSAGLGGMAIAATAGNDSVDNRGLVIGNVSLGSGTNAFNNGSGARIESGANFNLGSGKPGNQLGRVLRRRRG